MPPTRRPADRARLLGLVERLLGDERMQARTLTDEDFARIAAILAVLGAPPIPPAMTRARSA